ncbi:MAG: glycosyltransferase family 2 protein [Parcubacteria group bacterium CG10_big_fil_rev_8_21_14_0_10_38_31]|nr:MAG: glycosyltransferase family 2 protein [Parcubacteria group bacterium CG10_big_fil_rev_8_21_14_0_10_38_31]
MVKFSIIIPVYNEKIGVRKTIEDLKDFLKKEGFESFYEIIVIDDGSTDGTSEILDKIDEIKLIKHKKNKGYGAAIKTGVKNSTNDFICIKDADGTYPKEAIKDLLSFLPEYDMSVGARHGETIKSQYVRNFAKFFLITLVKILTGTRVPDLNSGLRVFKKSLFKEYEHLFPEGFSLTTTITVCSIANGHPVKYLPIDYHPRKGASKIHPIIDTYNFFIIILRTVLYFKPLKVLLPIALGLLLLSLIIGILSGLFLEKVLDTTVTILFVSGIQIFILALIADLIVNKFKKNG